MALVDGESMCETVSDRLNSFLTTGEIFDLFTTDELDALYDGLAGTAFTRETWGSPAFLWIAVVLIWVAALRYGR